MNLRSVRTTVAAERPATVGRLALGYLRVSSVDRLKSSLGSRLGVEFWASYNRRRTELLFDSRSVADPFEKRWVDPAAIRRRPRYGYFDKLTNIGSVRGGLWDTGDVDAFDHPTVRGLRERFVDGYAWEDTTYFERNVAAIESGAVRKGCSTRTEFLDVRCAYLDALFERISTDGYQTQEALNGAMIDTNRFEMSRDRLLTNEVGVNVGRDGSLLINSGYHRLAIAGILGLDEIPVQVIVRHRQWQRTRARVTAGGTASASVRWHPDLTDLVDDPEPAVTT